MSSKSETPVLIASLIVTAGLLGGGYWWYTTHSNLDVRPNPGVDNGSLPSSDSKRINQLADVEGVPSGLFNYGGSTTWAPIRGDVDLVLKQVHPAFQLRYTDPIGTAPGSGTGIDMLLDHQLSFAQSSRPLNPEEYQEAIERGFSLEEIPVAIEGLALAVHPSLPIDGITLQQLQDIYLGNLTNWNQIGGPEQPIMPVSRPAVGGTVEFFVETVLGESALPQNITLINTTTEALRFVSETPGAIYYASAPEVVGQCTIKPIAIGRLPDQLVYPYAEPYIHPEKCPAQRNTINMQAIRSGEYPLTRRLFVIVRADGQLDQRAGEAYASLLLTEEGQNLLNQAGFVSVR